MLAGAQPSIGWRPGARLSLREVPARATLLPSQPAALLLSRLAKLKLLSLSRTQITDAGCAALAAALNSGALPALEHLFLERAPSSVAAFASALSVWRPGLKVL